jgi:plastocyanin
VGLAVLFGLSSPLSSSPEEKAKAEAAKPDAKGKEEPESPKSYPPLDPTKGALEGKVVLKGKVPELPPLEVPAVNKDHDACAQFVKNERLVVSKDNEVRDAVLSVAGYKPAEKPKPRELTLDNKHCTFVPHTQATTAGSDLKLTNSDNFLHNTHALFAESFNVAVPAVGPVTKKLRKAGLVVMKCDIHSWMQGNIQVFDHDLFDVTDKTGSYKIVNIPPGEYDIELWHEFLAPAFPPTPKKIAGKVKIEAGKTAKLDITLEPPAK